MKKYLTLKTYNSRVEANIDKSYLESLNIESLIEADDLGGNSPYPFQPNSSGVLLKVAENDYKKAKELLDKALE